MFKNFPPSVLKYLGAETLSKLEVYKCTFPFAVSVTKNINDETLDQVEKKQEIFLIMPEKIQNKLISDETSKKIQQIGSFFGLQLLQMADISRAIRDYYFSELKLEDMPVVLAKEIPIDLAKAQEISRMVIQKIINDNSVEEASQAKLAQMTVSDAIKAYPEVGEQLITSEKIVLKNFPEPVRPCLKNWLADFTFTLGRDKHTAMDRGIYLFQSANGKRLNSQDRNKLAYVLKAFDENMPVSVNKDTKQILFQAATEASKPSDPNVKAYPPIGGPNQVSAQGGPATGWQNPKPQGFSSDMHSTVRFSSPQKLPYEKIAPVKTDSTQPEKSDRFKISPFHYNPVSGMVYDSEKEEETQDKDNHINQKNIVNLKDN